MGRRRASEQYTVAIYRDQSGRIDLAPLADAFLLLNGGEALDAALRIAHDLTAADYRRQAQRQTLEASAEALRAELAELEDRIRRAG